MRPGRFSRIRRAPGAGIRLFGTLDIAPVELTNPEVTEGDGVTHLYYDVVSRH